MSSKRFLVAGIGFFCALFLGSVQADDLIQVYEQALRNDPVFKQAQSAWWTAKQDLPIAISAYLPQVEVTDTYERQYSKNSPSLTTDGYMTQNVITLTATQAIFDFDVWTNIAEQSANVKSATATYIAAIQTEMATTATAYFNVLAAYDRLRFTIANKNAVKRQLVTAQQKFRVGLIAITGVYDAQARYDQANADEISDRNNLYDQLENLRAITGQHYLSLMGIQVQVPLVVPQPDDINTWVGTAVRQNYTLQADNYAAIAAHRNILNVALGAGSGTGGYMPTVDATASWSRTNNFHYSNFIPGTSNSWTNTADIGLSLDWDPFSGGTTYFSTKQARYQYLTALGVLEQQHRDVINQTRQSFLGVKSTISRIRADKQSIVSARNALQATEAGYTVGTRTMVDVLNDLTQVYQTENRYMDDQYTYINNFISLKEQAGTLSVNDMEQLNSWLKKNIMFPLPKSYYGSHTVVGDDTSVMHKLDVLTRKTPLLLPQHQHLSPPPPKAKKPDHSKKPDHFAKAPPTPLTHTTIAKLRVKPKPQAISAPQKNYVVQLFASDNRHSAQNYIKQSNMAKQLRIVKVDNLYKVFYGHFKDRSDALIAMDALPINHAKSTAWVFKYTPPKAKKLAPAKKTATTKTTKTTKTAKALPPPAKAITLSIKH